MSRTSRLWRRTTLETQVFTHTRTHWNRPLLATTRRIAESGQM